MRFDIAKRGNGLTYEIRNIVGVANRLKACGMEVTWENIGDPVQKGEQIPEWMKEVLVEIIRDNKSFGYSPTQGMDATREFLANLVNKRGKTQITPTTSLSSTGLAMPLHGGYSAIRVDARVILPEPTTRPFLPRCSTPRSRPTRTG
jgi:aspartate/methionine/tyrosine aminotransferase